MAELSITIPEDGRYIKLPYELIEKGFSRLMLFVLGKVVSFSNREGQACRSRYSDFASDFRCSKRHVSRVLKESRADKLIATYQNVDEKGAERARSNSRYQYVGEEFSRGFVPVDLYLFRLRFEIFGKERYLTDDEILVLSYIKAHCENPKTAKFRGTVRGIARLLKLSPSTVQNAITALMKGGLLSRLPEDRAVNGRSQSVFHVNEKLLRKRTKETKRAENRQEEPRTVVYVPKDVADVNAKSAREKYYSRLRDEAENRAEKARDRARTSSTFQKIEKRLGRLEFEIARAELRNTGDLLELEAEKTRLLNDRERLLANVGLTERDLRPRWKCSKCSDTGFLPNGTACDCYLGDESRP